MLPTCHSLLNVVTLGYHDVTDESVSPETEQRPAAMHYTLSRGRFREHLEAIQRAGREVSTLSQRFSAKPLLLTFDDGAAGADNAAADELERLGWRGHFFITTDWIGRPGFLDIIGIRDLRRRGHVIGSHTRSHPARMSHLSWQQLVSEWKDSRGALEDMLSEPVDSASVSDGYYTRHVGRAAAACGIRFLFNSEPTQRVSNVEGCFILGRYAIVGTTTASQATELACGRTSACLLQNVSWNAKKLLKGIAGERYLDLRRAILATRRG